MANVCGTGLSKSTVQPGDPDLNSSVLSAQTGLGGIALNWQYPAVNPEGLDRTVIYRNTRNNAETAASRYTATGNYFFDRIPDAEIGTEYFYWIRMYSVNGTEGELIGPASAVVQPTPDQIRDLLKGKVTESMFTTELTSKINDIELLQIALGKESNARNQEDAALVAAMEQLQSNLDEFDVLVRSETEARTSADSALVHQLNILLAKADTNGAAIQEERRVRADADEALAEQTKTLQAVTNDHDSKLEEQAIVNAELGAEWVLKTDVDGKVAGLALRNGDGESSFIINVDTFAVTSGKGDNIITPFIISEVNGETVITLDARTLIKEGDITNLMIGNVIQSNDFDPYQKTGWRLDKESGLVVYSGGYFEGDIYANNGTFNGEIHASGDSTFRGDVEADSLAVNDFIRIGQATAIGWEDIKSYSIMETTNLNVGERQTKVVLSLPVTVTDASHRVFVDWGVQILSGKNKTWWPCRVRFLRDSQQLYRNDTVIGEYVLSPSPGSSDLNDVMDDNGTTVECKDPNWSFSAASSPSWKRFNTASEAIANSEAVLAGKIGSSIPPYGGTPVIKSEAKPLYTDDLDSTSRIDGYRATSVTDSFAVTVSNFMLARGINGPYRKDWLSKSFWTEDNPGIGTHTYKIEVYIKDASTTPYTYAKDRFIEAIVQKPLFDLEL